MLPHLRPTGRLLLRLLTLLTVVAVLISGCVSSEDDVASTSTAPTTPSAVSTQPPTSSTPTSAPTPTDTNPTAVTTATPSESSSPTSTGASTATPAPTPTPTSTLTPTSTAAPTSNSQLSLADLLTLITVAAEVTDGYDRDDWKHWTDADRDGQDTRQEVLDAESLAATVVANRRIRQGLWRSLYDGQQITDAGQLDIDHVVALGEAHESGGWAWDASTRELYANDLTNPDHLIAVSRGTNRSKGKRDPAEWLPPDTASWCQYLALWTIVKVRWGLTMDQAEYNRILQEANSSCTTLRVDPARIER